MQGNQKIGQWLPGDRKGKDELQRSMRKLGGEHDGNVYLEYSDG